MDNLFALLPSPTQVSRPFWDGCNRGELLLQHCAGCGHCFYYARQNCPACGSGALTWRSSSGRGTVYSFTQVEVSFYGPQWDSQLPYTPVLVDLEDRVRMLSRLVGPDRGRVKIGDPVQAEFVLFEGQRLPYFRTIAG